MLSTSTKIARTKYCNRVAVDAFPDSVFTRGNRLNTVVWLGMNYQLTIALIAIATLTSSVLQSQEQTPKADGRPVSFLEYKETGEWQTWSDGRISIRIPNDWHVAIDAKGIDEETNEFPQTQYSHDEEWTYRLISPDESRVVLSVSVFRGGPEFVGCFCAPQNVYEYSEKDGFKIWALTLPGLDARMFKVASKTLRLDIHGRLPGENADQIRYIIESSRPVEPKSPIAK